MKRVVFTGPRVWGRTIEERRAVYDRVDHYGVRGYTIVQGGARGLDTLVLERCIEKGYRLETYYAAWNSQGRKAGPIRNVKMLSQPGVERVVGYKRKGKDWTRGTGQCVTTARGFDIKVEVVEV